MEETISMQHEYFGRLSAQRGGSARETLVLLHGFPEHSTLWREVMPRLQEHYTVIAPDFPGSGGSSLPAEGLSVEDMARATQAILDHLGIGEAVIAGHSMGGYVALAFAALFPERVRGLSLVHSSARADTEEKKEQRRKAIALIQKGGKDAFIRQMVPGMFAPATRTTRPELLRWQTEQALQLPEESLIRFYEAMIMRPDRTEMLAQAAFPLQWIIGRDDELIPPSLVWDQTSLTAVAFVSVYDHTGHMSMLEQPQRLAEDLDRFGRYCYNH